MSYSYKELKQQARQLLVEYSREVYGTESGNVSNADWSDYNVSWTVEQQRDMMMKLPTAKTSEYGREYRMTLWGPFAEIEQDVKIRTVNGERNAEIIEFIKANKYRVALWHAFQNKLSVYLSYSRIDTGHFYMTLDMTLEIYNNRQHIERLLDGIANIDLTKEDLQYGVRKMESTINTLNTSLERQKRINGTNLDNGLAKVLQPSKQLLEMARQSMQVKKDFINMIVKELPDNGLVARTWGFEVEVPDAKGVDVHQQSGIEKGEDGSLRSYESNDDCECDCDRCYYHECNCEHCDTGSDNPSHCGNSECATCDSAEFRTTGGIQRVKHSGLYKLSEDLLAAEAEMNDTAGTHIHVWAGDLTTNQVGHVMASYKLVSELLYPIAGRKDVGYAREVQIDHVRSALKQVNPVLVLEKSRAVNVTQLFTDRRTIEFRQMDCNLDADMITGWAWIVRGFVTAAKNGATLGNYKNVTNISELITVFSMFGHDVKDEHPGIHIFGSRTDKHNIQLVQHKQG